MPGYDRPYFESHRDRERGNRDREPPSSRRGYRWRENDDDRGPWISRDLDEFERDSRGRDRRYAGIGPKGYRRSDERLREEVCERLTADPDVDASEVEVTIQDGDVTLEGTVRTRAMKRAAEDCAEAISGVQQVHNRLRVEFNDAGRDQGEASAGPFSTRGTEGQRSDTGRKAH